MLVGGCGGGEVSLTEYVDRINGIEARASSQADELVAAAAQIDDLTPQDVQAGLEHAWQIRVEVEEAAAAIEPPGSVAHLHTLIFEWHAGFTAVEQALAIRAGNAPDTHAGWAALSASGEMAAYRAAIADGKQICAEFQEELDATAQRGVFADVPWVPVQMTEAVEAVLGCAWFPDDPEDVYRYPPPTSP